MNTILFKEKGNVKMIAHRGVSGLERENTCPAFLVAGVKSYYGIETDVHVTADGKFIICHDNDLKRIANIDVEVEKSSFEFLRSVKIKDVDEVTERNDLFLPSLEEYISICKKYDKQAILEIKNRMEKYQIEQIVNIIKAMQWFSKTTFISFYSDNIIDVRNIDKNASVQFLTGDTTEQTLKFLIDNNIDADFWSGCVTKEVVDKLHLAGLKVNCWTIDSEEDAKRLKNCGVDFITSNILEWL